MERFGYTYSELMDEDCTLWQLLTIEMLGKPEDEGGEYGQ